MPQYVERNESYSDAGPRDTIVQTANVTGHPIWVCDCCAVRKHYRTRAAVDAHENHSAGLLTAADLGIYPTLGEELADYLPAPGPRYNLTGKW
jgi:hypothetical protein